MCKIHWKLTILKSVLFCEYLCNESLDLYEILNLSSYVSNDLLQTFLWRSVNAHIHNRRKRVHMRWNYHVRIKNFNVFCIFPNFCTSKIWLCVIFEKKIESLLSLISKWKAIKRIFLIIRSFICIYIMRNKTIKNVSFQESPCTSFINEGQCSTIEPFWKLIIMYIVVIIIFI